MYKKSLKKSIFCALAATLGTLSLWRFRQLAPADLLLLFIWVGLYLLFGRGFDCLKGRRGLVATLLAGLLALFTALGAMAGLDSAVWMLLGFLGHWLIYSAALGLIYAGLEKPGAESVQYGAAECGRKSGTGAFFAAWGIFWAWFLLWLLYRYPGGVTVDSNLQLMQVLGLAELSNHHPVIHTMLIKVFFELGLKLSGGDQNFGVALYSAFQALMLAAAFAYLIATLYRERVRKWVLVSVGLIFILLPYHGSYSVTMWKDVWFGGIVLVLCVCLWRLMLSLRRAERFARGDLALFFVMALLMCLFRSNGQYAFVALLPFVTALIFKRDPLAATLPILALALAMLIKGPVYTRLGIVPVDVVEALSVPAQHIAYTIRDGGEISEEQYELLSRAVDPQAMAAAYTPGSADAVKEVMRVLGDPEFIENNKGEILKLWLELGLQNPLCYLRAQIQQTQGYWDPTVQYWVMAPDFLASYLLEIEADSKFPPALTAGLNALIGRLPALPLTAAIFSIGTAVWVLLALIGLCIVKRRYMELIVYLPVLAVWGTLLIATPIYAEFRYIYSLFTTLPLLGLLPFVRRS